MDFKQLYNETKSRMTLMDYFKGVFYYFAFYGKKLKYIENNII